MTDKEQLNNFVRVATGYARVKNTPKKTETQEYVDRLIARNHKDRDKMSERQFRAALLRAG